MEDEEKRRILETEPVQQVEVRELFNGSISESGAVPMMGSYGRHYRIDVLITCFSIRFCGRKTRRKIMRSNVAVYQVRLTSFSRSHIRALF